MNYTIQLLKEKQASLVEQLRQEKSSVSETLLQKKNIDKAIAWLEDIEKHHLEHPKNYKWVQLPEMQSGYSSFRIMNDGETDAREHWIEFKPPFDVTASDFLLIKKPE